MIGAPDVGQQAELWLAICLRMRGHNATDAFRKILKREPSNRIAFLNLAANYLTFPKGRCDAARQTFSELKIYIAQHPDDSFARLIEALLVSDLYCNDELAISLLEQLYLEQRNYTPGISVMAAILSNSGRRQAGIDYAREAASLEPWNYQALSLANYEPGAVPEKFRNYHPTEHVSFSTEPRSYESLLYGSYFLIDPQELPEIQG